MFVPSQTANRKKFLSTLFTDPMAHLKFTQTTLPPDMCELNPREKLPINKSCACEILIINILYKQVVKRKRYKLPTSQSN